MLQPPPDDRRAVISQKPNNTGSLFPHFYPEIHRTGAPFPVLTGSPKIKEINQDKLLKLFFLKMP